MRSAVALAVLVLLPAAAWAQEQQPPTSDQPPPSSDAPLSVSAEPGPQDQPAPPPPEGPKGVTGFKMGKGFRMSSEDGNYSLRVGLQAGVKFEPYWVDGIQGNRTFFSYLRPRLDGSLYRDWIRFWVSLELAKAPPYVLDAYVEVQPSDAFGIRLGQQYSPISRHEQYGPTELLFPEWNVVAEYFWPGRDKGAEIWGKLLDKKLEYYLMVSSGSPLRQTAVVPGNYVIQGRAVWNPLGLLGDSEVPYNMFDKPVPFRASVGLAGWHSKASINESNVNSSGLLVITPSGDELRQTGGSFDAAMQSGPFHLMVEGFLRSTDDLTTGAPSYTSVGLWGQASYGFWNRKLNAAARLSWLDPSTTLDSDTLTALELQLSWFIAPPYLIAKLRYLAAWQQTPDPALKGNVALGAPATGMIQGVTLQLVVYF